MKKYLFGSGIIAVGTGVSCLMSAAVLSMDLTMFNPDNRGPLMMQLILLPLVIFGGSYSLWYRRQAKKKTRDMKAYSSGLVFLTAIIIFDAAASFGLVHCQGFLDEAWGHIILNVGITTAAFWISMENFRPW